MSFDKNHESPDKIVNPAKRTTKVNIGMAIGVLVFFVLAAAALVFVMRNPPQSQPTPLSTSP